MSHECADRDLADALLSSAQRIHETYRRQLRQLVHERTDPELVELIDHYRASESMPQEARIAEFLLRTDIRVACKQEQNDRSAWADVEKEIGS